MVVTVIVAAGSGKRLGGRIDKALVPLLGHPLIAFPLALFEQAQYIDKVILVVREDQEKTHTALVEEYRFAKVSQIVAGGAERQQSVSKALSKIPNGANAVLIHDCARPLVGEPVLRSALDGLSQHDGVVVAVPVHDTIKRVEQGRIIETVDRTNLWQAQTPQAFRPEVIIDAHERAEEEGIIATDDGALAEHFGYDISVVNGDKTNIKITVAEDLEIAEQILGARGHILLTGVKHTGSWGASRNRI